MNDLLHAAFFKAPWFSSLGWALVHSLWEGALVALGAALVLRGMRGSSSRARYVVAVLALLLFVGLPLRRVVSSLTHTSASAVTVHLEPGRPPLPAFKLQAPNATPVEAPALRTRMAENLERALPWVVLTWAVGMMIFMLRLAGGWLWLQRLRWQRAELAPDVLQRLLLDLCRRSGLKRAVTLLTCEGLPGPSVVGFLRPAILVPAGWFLNLPPDHVEALLAHELAHVLRHDYLVNLLQSLLEVLFFYHPGLWWLSGRIRQERELACDAFATRLTGDPLPLAQALTFLERRGLAHANLEPALAAHGGSLMERIRQLLLPAPRTSSTPVFGAVAVMALILASGLHLAAQSPAPAPGMPTNMELPKGVKVDWDSTHLYLHLHNAKDVSGKVIPHAWTMDLVAREVPLNQVWATFQDTLKTTLKATGQCQSFSPRDAKVEGPKISLNLKGATPAEVQAALEGLAKENGVAPYEAPAPHTLGSFTIGKRTAEDKTTRYSLHARQVSVGYLPELLAEARRADKSVEFASGSMSWDRNKDTHSSPKVDAIFEDLPLAELEKRVNALIESAK